MIRVKTLALRFIIMGYNWLYEKPTQPYFPLSTKFLLRFILFENQKNQFPHVPKALRDNTVREKGIFGTNKPIRRRRPFEQIFTEMNRWLPTDE